MIEPDILYPAIFVFSMLLIGLILTMWEFSRLHKRQLQKSGNNKRVNGRDNNAAIDNVTGFSHF